MTKLFITAVLFMGMLTAFSQEINVDVKQEGETFEHFWSNCVGAGRANEGLRAGWLEQLELVEKTCGFKTVRFHGLFHDDMFPVFEEKGKTVYNWQYIDDLFDRMLDLNVRPFIELSFFPKSMAAENSKTQFWWKANITPDESKYNEWHNMLQAFTQHCVDRYGIDEVLTWYFEVWNEPNLVRGFWDGTKSQYFELYKQSVTAVRAVDNRLKVGGPSTSNFVADDRYKGEKENTGGFTKTFTADDINELDWHGVWIEDFLKYCEKEHLPVDFISTHPYPTDYPLDPRTGKGRNFSRHVESTVEDMKWLNKVLANSAYPNAEIHLTEWNTSPSSRDKTHDLLLPAAYIVRTNLEGIGLANSLAFWTFTDMFEEKGGAPSIFHGGFGLINFQGLVKPSYHAYSMLHQLGDEKLYKNDYMFVSRKSGNGKVVALAYNYPQEFYNEVPRGTMQKYENGSSRKLDFSLSGLKPGAQFKIETLDKDHGNVYNYWEKMGSPEPPTREQIKVLKKAANALKTEIVTADEAGNLNIDREISPWSLVLIKQIN
ncbi:hypothetical protein [uncultured Draconibacterium sp.]|uniref:GH39 family glycosyl hydrolase n=1 Tax=uncultured Draconibacterium sp. TaxID=1573823 RepID=UPI0029C72E56|nr:hypothetical protein [uncultured Draconibacterium sp.]